MFTATTRRITRWILLLPILMVGSLFYWSLAIGLGALSLMAAGSLSTVPMPGPTEVEPSPAEVGDGFATMPITVQLEESAEPEDVNDNSGAGGFSVLTDDQSVAVPGPGPTSF
jgi:hypothetical protein